MTFIQNYTKFNKFKKIIYALLAMISTDTEIKDLTKGFLTMDKNCDGVLNRMEI